MASFFGGVPSLGFLSFVLLVLFFFPYLVINLSLDGCSGSLFLIAQVYEDSTSTPPPPHHCFVGLFPSL